MPPSRNNPQSPENNPTAFPVLDDHLEALPEIPGGWKEKLFKFGQQKLSLLIPADPDLFLDDPDVLKRNEQDDYMPFWAFLWPSSIKMAEVILQAPWQVGSAVLELGSGLGLVGIAAYLRGDQVTFSDYDATALHICRMNTKRNSLADPQTLLLDWRAPGDQQFDAIIGCEVTYDAPMHPVILKLLELMLRPGGYCWLGDPGRYLAADFCQLARESGFQVRILNEELEELDGATTQEFQIIELVHTQI